MINLDLTNAVNNLIDGKATKGEQGVCGLVLKHLLERKGIEPIVNKDGRPYCPNCEQPMNTKKKNGKYIHEYCKCCGQKINWDGFGEGDEDESNSNDN